MRIALYARVSTDRQEARGTIGSQLEMLRSRAAEDGHETVGEYIDNGYSGATLDRPGLDALRDAAERRAMEGILCPCPDRLARSYAYQVIVIDELARYEVKVLFADAPPLDDDPQARLLIQVQGVIAEYERAKIAERCRRGKLYRSRLGEVIAGKAPYGYHRVPRGPEGPAHLVVNEPEAAVVRRIFTERVARGRSLREIIRGLAADGIPSATGRPAWRTSTLTRVLRNEAYVGRVYYNRTVSVPAPPECKSRMLQRPRPREEWIPISVPPIVAEEVFEAAKKVSVDNSKWSPRRAEPGAWLLRGLVKCGACGVGTNCHRMRGRNGTWHLYYYCRNHDPIKAGGEDRRCRERNVRAVELDEFVFQEVRKGLLRPDVLLAGEKAVARTERLPNEDALEAQVGRLERRLKAAEAERRRVLDLYQAGLIDFGDLKQRTEEIDTRHVRLEKELAALRDRKEELLSGNRLRGLVRRFAEGVLDGLDQLDFDQKQRLLRLVVEEVRVTGWHVEIRLRIPLDDDRPGGTRSPKRTGAGGVSSDMCLRSLRRDRRRLLPYETQRLGTAGPPRGERQSRSHLPPTSPGSPTCGIPAGRKGTTPS